MAQFNADIFQAIATIADAKTCANLLCVNKHVSSLKSVFTELHKVRTNELFQQLDITLQENFQRLKNRKEQFTCTVKTLQKMFNGPYNVEYQYDIHKHFQQVMQNNYSHDRVNQSLRKYILETNDYNDEDKNIFEVYSSYLFGTGFSTVFNIETYDEQYEIVLVYYNSYSIIELQIVRTDTNITVFDDQFMSCDFKDLLETIYNICGEYAFARKPKHIGVEITEDSFINNCMFNIMITSNNKQMLESITDIFQSFHKFKNEWDDKIIALF